MIDYTRPKHDLATVLEAVEKGITIAGIARTLNVTRQTVYAYRRRWKAVDDAIVGKRKELVDLAEVALRAAVINGDSWAVAFTLRMLGKDEGYSERHEVTGKDGDAIELRVVERIVTRRDNDDTATQGPG